MPRLLCMVCVMWGCIGTPAYIDPQEIWPVVSAVYSEHMETATPECEAWLAATRVVPSGAPIPGTDIILSELCSGDAGCHIVAHGRSYVWCRDIGWADDVNICYGHEYLHALSYCMTGLRDPDHEIDGLWCNRGYLCRDLRGADTRSVEFGVNKALWGMY